MRESRRNLLIIALVTVLALAAAAAVGVKGFTQGLDLKGGLEVVLKAQPKPGQQVTATMLDEAANVMRQRIDPNGVKQPEVRTSLADKTIEIALPGVRDPNAVADLLTAGQLLNFDMLAYANKVSWDDAAHAVVPASNAWDLLTAADKNAGPNGAATAAEWALFDTKTHKIYNTNAPLLPTKQQVLAQAHLQKQPPSTTWLYVPKDTFAISCNPATEGTCQGVSSTAPNTYWYLFNQPPPHQVVTGNEISSAQSTTDQSGNPIVAISYKGDGAGDFLNATRQSVATAAAKIGPQQPGQMAIVVDNRLVSVSTVDAQKYPGGIDASLNGSEISGVTKSEADRIALEIQSGTLPVTFTTQSENVVSATLGKDALRSGLIAGAAGLAFVMVFLIAFYGFLGLVADLALVIYGLLLAGIVAIMPVTMTLPGIAGTILTIGVAADANIVIFERIKEEVRAGKTIRTAIATGYRRGFHTIIDANVVTLITAAVLYVSATSSVKGFALMLLIGVTTSVITAVVATRALLGTLSGFGFMASNRVLGAVGSGDRWKRFDFIGRKAWWFGLSAAVLSVGAISLGMNGLNQGIDFTGGSQLDFRTTKALSTGAMTDLVTPITGSGTVVRGLVGTHQTQGDTFTHFQIQSHFLSQKAQSRLLTTLEGPIVGAPQSEISIRNVSSSFGQSVLNSAYLAILFSLIIIFIYVTFRFEWAFAIPVMIALGHDILLTVGVYSLSGRAVTADTVAAVLTVLGYSLYDTVIVFDRVRENVPILRRMTASRIVNESLAETITRSLNTSLVTLIPVVLLFVFGS
ncbi:MAG: protein translocase subunit SecD, partial [Gaiellales bacterium]